MDAAKAPGIFIHQYAGLPHGPAFEHWRERACGPCGLDIGPSRGDSIDCRLQISVVDNIAVVPEPASSSLLVLSGIAILATRWRPNASEKPNPQNPTRTHP